MASYKFSLPFVTTIIGILVFGTIVYVAAQQAGIINGCVDNGGELSILGNGSKKKKCSRQETPISWNTQGVQGPQGPKGDKGDAGASGAAGAGDVAFVYYYQPTPSQHTILVLKKDGTTWVLPNEGADALHWRLANNDPPIPIANIVSWQYFTFLDTQGQVWENIGHGWLNLGTPTTTI